ncbi:transmembrane protein 8B isoform X3 [Prionailurus iriomotensis]
MEGGLFLTDYSTCSPRKLSPFRSFASTELFHFHVPEDTFLAVWNLIIFKEQGGTFGDHCPDQSVTVYFRSGAPPVINPLHTHFPGDTAVPGVFSLTLSWTLPNRTSGIFNVSSPLPGDWFLAAHLPQAHGHISVKGNICTWYNIRKVQKAYSEKYLPGGVLGIEDAMLQKAQKNSRRRVVRSSGLASVKAFFQPCGVLLEVSALAGLFHEGLQDECQYLLQPQLIVRRLLDVAVLVPGRPSEQTLSPHNRSALYNTAECPQPSLSRVLVPGAAMNMPQSLGNQPLPPEPPSLGASPEGPGATSPPEHCWPVRPTLRNELDTFSVHFYIFFGPSVALPPERPAVFALRLLPVLDSGGVLSLELQLNVSSLRQENVTVFGCLTHEVPLSLGDAAVTCSKESLAGFLLSVSATSRVARLRIPFPQTGTWFLTLRSLCGVGPRYVRCRNATAEVRLRTFLSPCVDDCGPYGQCKLLRTHNYLYAACECKAGWRGWGCTDSADALTYGFQLLSTLLLCLSNLMFLPPVVLAIRSRYVLEAAVYTFTMFFSTFYHACDQPGIVVFCIMDYDVLQFCDFLGSLMSVWVTVIAMARLQPVVKQVLYLLGAMLLSMALQLDRHGLWNLLGPSLFALGILATAWTVRSVRRRHCYPPTWRRWLFYLCPGSLIAGSAVLLYAFVETRDNYFYIHSIWHMLIAGSVGFLLPPRAKTDHRVPSGARARGCGYQLCINEQEELGLVGPGGATVSSICAS